MARDKEKQKLASARWYKNVVKPRRKKWFLENGPCVVCGSWEKLELHHKDPSKKESHNIWSWKEDRRLMELSKCEVRCMKCHIDIHRNRKPITHGSDHRGYHRGCRCALCKEAHSQRLKKYRNKLLA